MGPLNCPLFLMQKVCALSINSMQNSQFGGEMKQHIRRIKNFDSTLRRSIPALIILILSPLTASARTTVISSLPYTANQYGVNYSETLVVAGTNLVSATNGINVIGHDIVINLGGDTITFGSSGADLAYGINIGGQPAGYNVKIVGGWLIHGITNDTLSNGVDCFRVQNATHNILIQGTNMKVSGDNAHCIDYDSGARASYGIEVDGGHYWSYCRRYNSREYYDGAVVRASFLGSQGGFGFRIHGVRIWTGPGQGIASTGQWGSNPPNNRSQVYSCTVSVDHRNDFYLVYQGPNHPVGQSSENAYAIFFSFCGPGSSIHDNVVRSGEYYGGGRGIFLESSQGTPSEYLPIYNNDVETHEGPNIRVREEYGTFGLRLRPIDGELKYIHVYNNKFVVAGDSVAQTTAYGYIPEAIRYSNNIFNSYIIIENNLFRAYAITPGPVESHAITFDGVIDVDSTLIVRGNRFESDHVIIKYGGGNFGANNILLSQDTLKLLQGPYVPQTYHVGHLGNNWDCSNNVAVDNAYEGTASDTNIFFATGGTLDLKIERTLTVQVMGRNGIPVRNATVTAVNNYDRQVFSGASDGNGFARGPVAYWFESRTQSDSTAYNNFTVTALKGTDSTVITFTVTRNCPPVIITLDNTDGDGQNPDIVPPSAITDLTALPGGGHGGIDLSWTAPGDDSSSGMADHYVMKYSQNIIDESSWPYAEVYPNPPAPIDGGQTQQFTVDGMAEGGQFYLAIKSYDEENNGSLLSNVPFSFASGIEAPAPISTQVDHDAGVAILTSSIVDSYYPLYYIFALDDDPGFASPRIDVDLIIDSVATATFDSLLPQIDYYWRCRAVASNLQDSSAWSSIVNFNVQTGVDMLLTSGDCLYPAQGAIIQSRRPVFSVRNVPEVNEIFIQVADNPGFDMALESGRLSVAAGPQTEWPVTQPLWKTGNYYWRISSNNSVWTSPLSFAAEIDVHPYPNPFKVSAGHNAITFTNLPERCNIDIASVSGAIVKKARNIGPNDWIWDVKNDSGNDIASGVYLYVVEFPNGSASGKVMIIR